MTLIELLVPILMIALGACAAKALYPMGGLWLAIPGFLAGILLIPLIGFIHNRYRRWAYLGDKWMPECSCGSSEYKYERVGEEYHLLCQQCRKRYEKRREQVSVYEEGQKRPYKRLVKHQGWV
jgi:hypothetical protein